MDGAPVAGLRVFAPVETVAGLTVARHVQLDARRPVTAPAGGADGCCVLTGDAARVLRSVRRHVKAQPDCDVCAGGGWVCEAHPLRPWGDNVWCCGAPVMPCPRVVA